MKDKPWLPYVVPFGLYMAFLMVQSDANLPWIYPLKTITVAAALWFFRKHYTELRWQRSAAAGHIGWGVVIGLIAIAIWIWGDPFYPKFNALFLRFDNFIGRLIHQPTVAPKPETFFDPHKLGSPSAMGVFIGFRIVGAVIVVPLMEELFWRAFLIRWLVNEDFKAVAVGTFTWASFAITVAMFGAEHNQWLAGLVCGALYNWLYYKRKDVGACVVAHAVSNAALAAYVLATGDWKFW